VSRDGKTIVFASTQHRPTADLYTKCVDSRVVTQITSDPANDLMPRLSPDGTRIAFASDRSGNWDIYVMPVSGGKPIQVTASPAHELHPSWSPEGGELVFCRLGETSGQWEMWITSVSNPGVARFIGNGLFPEWCPVAGSGAAGADRIAFQKSRERGDRAFGIWVMDYKAGEAGNSTEIASTPTAACINPAWSQDGQWIAYATVPNPSQWSGESRPAWAELWMVDTAGNNRVALTGGRFVNLMPAWGPNNRLFFVSDRAGVDNIWALDTAKVIALAASNSAGAGAVSRRTVPGPGPGGLPLIVDVPENSTNPPH
jgi:Tol biopolymer transport system component